MSREHSRKLADQILSFAEEKGMHPEYDAENGIIRITFGDVSCFDTVYVTFHLRKSHIVSCTSTNLIVKEDCRIPFAELITRINNHRAFGCFELDMESGEFTFRHLIDLGEGELNDKQIESCFLFSVGAYAQYGDALLKVMLGMATAKEAFDGSAETAARIREAAAYSRRKPFPAGRSGKLVS